MATLPAPIYSAEMAHHFAGKLDGYVVALIEAPGNVYGSHAVITFDGTTLTQMACMPEATARRAYWELVGALGDICRREA